MATKNEDNNSVEVTKDKEVFNSNWLGKIQKITKNITVEPIVAAYIIPCVLGSLATQNLNLDKACRVNMEYGDEICDALIRRETANYTMQEETVQKMVAHMGAWKTVIQSIIPCLLILFWGSWSDRHHRRKPCILIPVVGEFLCTIGLILCVYFEKTPMEVAGLNEAIFPAFTGGWFTMLMGVFSYMADITSEEERTFRIGLLNVCFSTGVPIGTALSGVLLKQIGFYGVFFVSLTMYSFAIIYGIFYLPEARPRCIQTIEECEAKSLLGDFFDMQHVVDTFKVAFKKGQNKRRVRVILLMIVVMVVMGPSYGDMNVLYLSARYRFNWNEVEFSMFNTFAVGTGLIGLVISVGILSHMMKVDDAIIGVLSSVAKILSSFVYAFATLPWHMYAGAIVETLNGTSLIAMRSMATKLVSKDELGKVNSLFGVAEALTPVLFGPMYSTLYAATIHVFPGAFYLLGGGITVFAVIIFLWLYNFQVQMRRKQMSADNKLHESEITKSNISNHEVLNLPITPNDQFMNITTKDSCDHVCDHTCTLVH